VFIVTPDTVKILADTWDDFVAWMQDHLLFFGCSGILAWLVVLVLAVLWLIKHVRFV